MSRTDEECVYMYFIFFLTSTRRQLPGEGMGWGGVVSSTSGVSVCVRTSDYGGSHGVNGSRHGGSWSGQDGRQARPSIPARRLARPCLSWSTKALYSLTVYPVKKKEYAFSLVFLSFAV